MALNARVKRLEQVWGTKPAAPCPTCGAPRGHRPVFDVVDGDGAAVLSGCGECGVALGDEGRPLFALSPGRGQKLYGAKVDWRGV